MPGRQRVDGDFEQADRCAECSCDQVEFVLDHQIGRSKSGCWVNSCRWVATLGRMLAAIHDVAMAVIGMHVSVPIAQP